METIMVEKLDAGGRSVVSYQGAVVQRFAGGICLEAHWALPARDLGYARFEPGDRFVEWFYADRWYNIFEIHARDSDGLVGWYCNVAAPATITDTVVSCRDLLLDLWVKPDGAIHVLDEEEFAADETLDAEERAAALRGLASLRSLVERRAPPFDAIVTRSPRLRQD